jgi:hypothetical protein
MMPIQTRYAGCHFRSRLEARWAVFFDRLEIEWQYEPEGFDLGRAGWYLPDFRIELEDGRSGFVEVKPLAFGAHPEVVLSEGERHKISALSEAPNMYVMVVGEHGRDRPESGILAWRWIDAEWTPSRVTFGRGGPDLIAGWNAARSARFEHGQEGAR